jgi:mRNA-degrading endonuclease toxin of MazEF toxin-antitoxin module
MTQRGDVIVVAFPYVSGGGENRPALVVQCDRNNRRLQNAIVATITGNIRLAATEPPQMLIDPATPEGKSSGLANPSAVKCENLYTISQGDILRKLGSIPPSLMARVGICLKDALGLPWSS